MKYLNHIMRLASTLLLLLAGWGMGLSQSAQQVIEVVPDQSSNLYGTSKGSYMQPLDSLLIDDSAISFSFSKGTGSTAPAYYSSGSAIRLYSGNTMTMNAPSDFVIEKVEFQSVAYRSNANTLTANSGTLTYDSNTLVYTWTNDDNEQEAVFTISNTQLRISGIKLTLNTSGDIQVRPKRPVLSKASCEFFEPFELAITDVNTPSATIRYTIDGTTPSATDGSVYTSPLTIPTGRDVTVNAVAVNDKGVSAMVSATYNYVPRHLLTVEVPNKNAVNYVYYSSNSDYAEWRNGGGSTYVKDGETVSLSCHTNSYYNVTQITVNGKEQADPQYGISFVMPSEDVKVKIDTKFNPNSPSDPQPADTTKLYTLTAVCNPVTAASVSGSGKYAAGDQIRLSAYNNSGYVFTSWTLNGEQVSTSSYFYYTMPAADVVLTANYAYNPSSPDDPEQPALMHPLTAIASPAGSATFSTSGSKVKYGDSYYVRAYPQSGYKLKGWIVNGVPSDNTSTRIEGVMTDAGAQVVALCVFDPSSPDNPGANYYNPNTGQVIVDDFTEGNLYGALNTLVSGNYDNVSSIIVKGRMTSDDYRCLLNLTNVQTIDLSRTGGNTQVPYRAFRNLAVANVVLPASVTSFNTNVFSDCANLSSITIYAQEPPQCSQYTFEGFTNKANCTVYVPREALELYANAEYWKDFTILPITNDAHVLQVNLPADADDGRYKHNRLEVVNINTGMRQKYVVSDRLLYTFNGLQKDEQYNVYMLSQSGLEIGCIENIIIPDNDIAVTFDNMKALYGVATKVVDANGNDVTSQVTVEWLNPLADGTMTYLRKATTLGEIPDGQQLVCRVTLDDKLGRQYAAPADSRITVSADNSSCEIALQPLRQVKLSGTIVDGDGTALAGAMVNISQTVNGKFEKSCSAKTNADGQWTATVVEASETRITYTASECVDKSDTISLIDDNVATMNLGTVKLRSLVGARINYTFTYKAAGADQTEDYYSDYKNVDVSVYNITQRRVHDDISVQYPVVAVLDENVQPGDSLKLVVTSKTSAFTAIEDTVVVDEKQRAETVFNIIGKGGISAAYSATDNPSVVAMLYSSKGELVKKAVYADKKMTFAELEDGTYTLVSMGQSELMSAILRLSNFEEIGLKQDKDYVKSQVEVRSGKLTEIAIDEVPAFDESLFYYTSSATNFSVNKSSVTTGAYLTLRSAVDFKGVYKDGISNVALVVDLPEGCDFVEKSVIQGPNLLPYTIDNNRLTVQLGDNYQSQLRFCVIPTTGGDFTASAAVTFEYGGRTITQAIGAAASTVKDIEISVPSVIASASFKVSGTALAGSSIKIMEEGTVLGTGKANNAGLWSAECELSDPYNLSTHSVYAEILTPAGNKLASETKALTYDVNAVQVSKVTMYHYNPEMNKTYSSVFDFMNPKTAATQWTVYYPKKKFTYTIEFTDNNPDRISNVVLYVHTADGKAVPCNAMYDAKKQLWYAEIDMGSSSNGYYPVNCSVDFDYKKNGGKVDKRKLTEIASVESAFMDKYTRLVDNVDNISETMTDEQWAQFYADNGLTFEEEDGDIEFPADYSEWTDEAKAAYLADLAKDMDAEMESISQQLALSKQLFVKEGNTASMQFGDGSAISVKTCDGITAESLIADGFTAYECMDGSVIYTLISEEKRIYVDFENDMYVETNSAMLQTLGLGDDLVATLRKMKEIYANWNDKDIAKCINLLKEIHGVLENANTGFTRLLANGEVDMMAMAQDWLTKLSHQQGRYRQLINKAPNSAIAAVYRSKLDDVMAKKALALGFKSCVKPVFKLLAKSLPISDWLFISADLIDKGFDIRDIYKLIDSKECLDEAQRQDYLNKNRLLLARVGLYAAGSIIPVAIGDAEIFAGMWTTLETGGVSLGVSAVGFITKAVAQISTLVLDNMLSNDIQALWDEISAVRCLGQSDSIPHRKDDGDGGAYKSGSTNDDVQIDPSGFVYEAVPANRVEGVQATIYYKEAKENIYGDPYEEVVLWNAEDYAQQNPLFTDENGMYRWDVPQGLWQVKFEKDGYVTAYSEWLPVPPPQLDVNVAITQNKQPEVVEARAYEEGIEVQFDKFMNPATLDANNIFVTANNVKLGGEIKYVDSELADEFASEDDADAARYVSRIRFVPEQPLSVTTGEIRLTVSRNVKSYAGIPMAETYSQVLDVEKEVQTITAADTKVLYGEEKAITVYATPFEAVVGRTLHVANSSTMIATLVNSEAQFDAEGKATVTVKGDLPGSTMLAFSIDDVLVTGQCAVDVVKEIITAEAPVASRANGSALYRGTKVELATESKNATIYFTTDGSCPCDENGTRRKYTVPIVVDGEMHIKAITAVGNGGEEVSDVVEFNYTLKTSDVEYQLPQGWSWISHNLYGGLDAVALAADENVRRILSQTKEMVRDPQLGLIGTLDRMTAVEGYKVETSAATARQRYSDIAWNPVLPISLNAGWNWIGYPVGQTMTVDEAFATTVAEKLDVVVGQNGFAQFDGEHWIGTLETMSPGLGYMYQSASDKNIVYNTAIVSQAAAKHAFGIDANTSLVVDIHKYGKIMPVIASLYEADGMQADCNDYRIAAFCGTECRGIGKVVNGLVMMNVYGNTDDDICFGITDKDSDNAYDCKARLKFSETVVGDILNPYVITIGQTTGMTDNYYGGTVKIWVEGDKLMIKGLAANEIRMVEVFNIDGQKVVCEANPTESGTNISNLTGGVYVVVVADSNGGYTYHKISIR